MPSSTRALESLLPLDTQLKCQKIQHPRAMETAFPPAPSFENQPLRQTMRTRVLHNARLFRLDTPPGVDVSRCALLTRRCYREMREVEVSLHHRGTFVSCLACYPSLIDFCFIMRHSRPGMQASSLALYTFLVLAVLCALAACRTPGPQASSCHSPHALCILAAYTHVCLRVLYFSG